MKTIGREEGIAKRPTEREEGIAKRPTLFT